MRKFDITSISTMAHGVVATLSGTTPAKGNMMSVDDFGTATFLYATGVVTDAGAAGGFTVEIQESLTTADAGFSAVADADLTRLESALSVTVDTQDGVPIGMIGYLGSEKYVRAVITGTTGTDATVVGIWLGQHGRYAPPTSDIAANVAAT